METVLTARALRKEYGSLVAVDDVDLEIRKGEILGLIGPNGAGKTTLLRMLGTLLTPTSGEIRWLGLDASRERDRVRKVLGYMPDFFNLYPGLTLRECVGFFGRAYGVPEETLERRVEEAVAFVGLSEKLDASITHLSRGMTQRLGVANLLVHDPALILLDEPASGLDPTARIQLRDVLKRLASEGKTVVVSSHILTELEDLCSHLCVMAGGRILAKGSVAELRKTLGASRIRLSLGTDSEDSVELARALLGEHPDVTSVEREGSSLFVHAPGEPNVLAALNRKLVEAGLPVIGLGIAESSVEDLFMQLTESPEPRNESDPRGVVR